MHCKLTLAFITFIFLKINLISASDKISSEADFRVLGKVEATCQVLDGGNSSWTTFKTQDSAKAKMVASKLLADLKGIGDIKKIEGTQTRLSLAGAGSWLMGVEDSKVHVLFSKTSEAFEKLLKHSKYASWAAVEERAYPRWLDRFDNDALSMGLLGFGALPQDIDDEIKWMGENGLNIAGNCYYKQDMMLAPGVFDFTIPDYYAKIAADLDRTFVPYTNWLFPWKPTWIWNKIPLPHIISEDGTFVSHNRIEYQRLANYSGFDPLKATDGIAASAYREQAEHFAAIPNCNIQFGFAEVGNLTTLSLSSIAGMPEVKAAWHDYLKGKLGYDLAKVGTLYKGDSKAYGSWSQVELPTMKTFAGWNPESSLDLRGIWDVKPRLGTGENQPSPNDSMGWVQMHSDDPILLIYSGKHGGGQESSLWMKRKFSLKAGELSKYKFLHISRNNWHRGISPSVDVFINGKAVKNISWLGWMTDCDLSYDLGDVLVEGENVIAVNTRGNPIPGYIFLNDQGKWTYPSDNEKLNRLYFDVTEFAAHYRMQGIENVLKALRAGDPQGRPMQVMAPWDFVDLTFDLFKKYGAYGHDTGQGGSCWAPWMPRYYTTRGMPISSEPGGPPKNVETMRKYITLWMLLGDDAVNLLFDPSQYAYRDKNSVGGWIENNRELLRCIGKMDMDKADVGVMRSIRNASRFGFKSPWQMDISRGELQSVGRTVNMVDPSDFANDKVNEWFDVVFDAASELLTDEEMDGIERFIKKGGTFIAFERTGIHSPEKANAWPLSKISGLKVIRNEGQKGSVKFAESQNLWPSLKGKETTPSGENNLGMEAQSKDVEVIAEWSDRNPGDGKIAIASRRLGKGKMIVVGANFWRSSKDEGGRYISEAKSRPYLDELLTSLNVPSVSYRDSKAPESGDIFAEHWLSKNGLYDLYVIARVNDKGSDVGKFTIGFRSENPPAGLIEISAQGHPSVPFKAETGRFTLENLELLPMQIRVFAAPRKDITRSPIVWLESLEKRLYALPALTARDIPPKPPIDNDVLPLNDQWTMCSGGERWGNNSPIDFDWSTGRQVTLGAFANLGLPNDALAHFKKVFSIPPSWKGKRVKLSFATVYWRWGIVPNGRLWVNGKLAPIKQPLTFRADGSFMFDLEPDASGKVVLEIEIDGKLKEKEPRPRPSGVTGCFFVQADPMPKKVDSLNGTWMAALDINAMTPAETGSKAKYIYLEKKFKVPPKNEWITPHPYLESSVNLGWVILNGQVVSTPGHMNRLNVSGLLKTDGSENVLRWLPQEYEPLSISRVVESIIPELNLAWCPNN